MCKPEHRWFVILMAFSVLPGIMWLGITPGLAEEIAESAFIQSFAGHRQGYALSCESRSAVDWAGYWGVSISETDFLNNLPRSDNPEVGFVGDPNGMWGNVPPQSYGVHAEPVANLLHAYGLQADARRNFNWDDLRREISAGRPVIVWVIGAMWSGWDVQYMATDGQQVRVAAFEHTMVIVGYDAYVVYAVDAFSGASQAYSISAFLQSWKVLENMAVTGSGIAPPPLPPPTETPIPPTPSPTPWGTPDPTAFAVLLRPKARLYFPLIARDFSVDQPAPTPSVEGVCVYKRQNRLVVEPYHVGRGKCFLSFQINSAVFLDFISLPELE